VAFGLLSTHSRLHGDTSYRVPWLFNKEGEKNGEEACAVTKHFAELKCSLMPYIFAKAVEANRLGVPVMRAMALEFEKDLNALRLDTQYMLGESILVAPIFKENGNVDYYLPEGKWTHLLTNETRGGTKWYNDTYDFFSLPLYVRENTILPIGKERTRPDYDYTDGIELHIFELNNKAETNIYGTDTKIKLNVKAENTDGRIKISLDTLPNGASIILRGVHSVKTVSGATYTDTPLGIKLEITNKEISVDL
jgi:alpha-D-xyloside xylohydrolase